MTNNTVASPLESIKYTRTRTITIDPEILCKNRVVMGLCNDPRADIFRVLRTTVMKQLRKNNWNSFAVTSATPGAGKTMVSINLAIAIALEANQSVIVVDADLRRPLVGHTLGFPVESGLIDYLTGRIALEDILVNPGIERLVILPGRDSRMNSSELVSSPRMVNMVNELKARYESRIIIFDIPPLFVADDALLFMPYIDAALLVVEDGKNTTGELHHSLHVLEQTNLLGVVMNKSRQTILKHQYPYIVDNYNTGYKMD